MTLVLRREAVDGRKVVTDNWPVGPVRRNKLSLSTLGAFIHISLSIQSTTSLHIMPFLQTFLSYFVIY
jgi:hypothetical protein